MKRKLNRVFAMVLAMLLLVSGILTGCGELVNEIAQSQQMEVQGEAQDEKQDEAWSETPDDAQPEETQEDSREDSQGTESISEEGEYTSKEDVALYLYTFAHLPSNFITKKEAQKLGWVSKEGNLGEVAPGKSIGGDYFGNFEGILPEAAGREYHECDIDSDGGYRGAKRIVYSNDGLIYYTEDHYESFELLYGEE